MEIKVLQGINFEAAHTLIKITLDGDPEKVTPLLDQIKSYHEVLIKEYSVDDKTISIDSKLTHLWKSCADSMNDLSTGVKSLEEAEEDIVGYKIKNHVGSMSTLMVLSGAVSLNKEITQAFFKEGVFNDPAYESPGSSWNKLYAIGAGRSNLLSVSVGTTGDAIKALHIQRDKWATNTYADRLSMPIAKWDLLNSDEDLERVFEDYKKPVVIKPTGLTGGNGVTTNVHTLEQAQSAFKYAYETVNSKNRSAWQRKIMIQEQVEGEDYRLLVVGGKLEVVTKRIPAFVIGDGKSTLEQLIEESNRDPRRNMRNPAHILKPIKFDEKLTEFITEQGLTLDHIPASEEKVYVRKVASMSQGGITEDFTEKVHPQIRYVAESMARSIHAHVAGIDVICKDITEPLTRDNGSFIEMNTMPEAYLNAFPVIGRQHPEIGEKIISALLDKEEPVVQVVAVGGELPQLFEKLESEGVIKNGVVVCTYTAGKIYLDSELINEGLENWEAIESVKLNALPGVILLHYADTKEAEDVGLGFNQIDYLIANKRTYEKLDGDNYSKLIRNKIEI